MDPVDEFDPDGRPCTLTVLTVKDAFRGAYSAGDTIEYCASGGLSSDGRLSLPIGVPTLVEGDTYVLFLKTKGWGVSPIVNGPMGALREMADSSRVTKLVTNDGYLVTGLSDAGFDLGRRIGESGQQRMLRANGVAISDGPHETGEGIAEAAPVVGDADLKPGLARDAVVGRIRAAIPRTLAQPAQVSGGESGVVDFHSVSIR